MSGWFRKLGQEKPWAQGCVVFCAGCVLAVSGCFGFLMSLDFGGASGRSDSIREIASLIAGGLFVLGALALPTGFVWWIVGMVKANKKREATEAAAAAASAPTPAPPPPPTAPE